MANHRKIIELVLEGRSYNEIVQAVGCSRRDVSVVKKTLTARGITAGRYTSRGPVFHVTGVVRAFR
jgi:uncharacterized protein YerC